MKSIGSVSVFLVAIGLLIFARTFTQFCAPELPLHSLPRQKKNQDALYASSLSTLRCLATPDCFPSTNCRTEVPQKLKREHSWEERAFCMSDVQQAKDCLVYSFGIHDSWEWEEKIARLLHCEVHAFDPTMNHSTNLAPGVTFHKLGLQAEGTDVSTTHSALYNVIDSKLLLPLGQIMKRLGHVDRKLDVLAMDCEGCEWGVISELACSGESALVDQLIVEFHFQKNLGLATPDDVILAAQGIDCLWADRWHMASIESSSAYFRDWEYVRDVPQLIHDPGFLLYASLQRIPPDQLRPSDFLEQSLLKSRNIFETHDAYRNKYGTENEDEWPQDARDTLKKMRQDESAINDVKEKVSRRSSVQFDRYEYFAE
jgi:hypothetical protein